MTVENSEFKYFLDYAFKKNLHDEYKNKYEEILDTEVGHSPEDSKTTDRIDDESNEDEETKISKYNYTSKHVTM